MLVIKPYGRTVTEDVEPDETLESQESKTTRKRRMTKKGAIKVDPTTRNAKDVTSLFDNPEFKMAQWISELDKIIRRPKPPDGKKAISSSQKPSTETQCNARKLIGEAAWKLIGIDEDHKETWMRKVCAYYTNKSSVANNRSESPRGTRYKRYIDESIPIDKIDKNKAKEIAEKINSHLNGDSIAKKIETGNRKGKIRHQLDSIEKNVHRVRNEETNNNNVAVYDLPHEVWEDYSKKGKIDVVQEIYDLVHERKESSKNFPKRKPKQVKLSRSLCGEALYEHFKEIFRENNSNKEIPSISELKEPKHPKHQLWLIHQAIKDYYKRSFDNASKLGKEKMKDRIPKNISEMKVQIKYREINKDTNYMIRLGKVLHYEAADSGKTAREAWNEISKSLSASKYWLSDGQAEIKRNEALVRVFKQSITHANRTLTYLIDWHEKDILLIKPCEVKNGGNEIR